MKTFGRGASTTGIIVAVVVLAVVGFGGAYFFSDVFRTRTDATITEWTKWTPANIAKDPINYLNFCETQTKAALEKCRESEISLNKQRFSVEEMQSAAKVKHTAGTKALDELKPLYKAAEQSDSFPIKWNDTTLDKEAAKRQIVRFAKDVDANGAKMTRLTTALKQLDIQKRKLAEAKDNANEQLEQIKESRDMLKVQAITDNLKETLVSMKGMIQSSDLAASEPSTLSLEDLVAKSDITTSDEDFNKIMNEK